MTIVKQLVQFAVVPLAMAASVALSLWILLGILHIERLSYPARPQPAPLEQDLSDLEMEPAGAPTAVQLRAALIRHGYSIGPLDTGGNMNDETMTALRAFQDNNAVLVQPTCDPRCWTLLSMPAPEAE